MATVAAPIDATSTAAWKALEAHQEKLEAEGIDLKAWFAADAERVNKLSFDAGDLHFDLSKNLVTDETVKLLCDLAREVKLEERRDAMFSGEHINTTDDWRRPAHRAAPPGKREGPAHRRRPGCRRRRARGSRPHVRLCRARALR